MKFPDLAYITWAKSLPRVDVNLARSGIDHCPASRLRLETRDLVATLPVKYGYAPLREAIARRYGAAFEQVFPVSGGTSFANWLACAAVLDGCRPAARARPRRVGELVRPHPRPGPRGCPQPPARTHPTRRLPVASLD